MDSVKNAGHAVVALFFESFRAPFYRKRKIEKWGEKKKKEREENFREHGCVRANNFVAEFALVQ